MPLRMIQGPKRERNRNRPQGVVFLLVALLGAGCAASDHGKFQTGAQVGQTSIPAPAETELSAPLRDEWIDPATGHRVVRLSRLPGSSHGFYFHQDPFTRKGDKMVFSNSAPDKTRRLFTVDLRTHAIEQLTDQPLGNGVLAAKSRQVFFISQGVVYATHLDTRQTRAIATLPEGWSGLTVNADETMLAGGFGEGEAEIMRDQPRAYWFKAIHAAKLPHLIYTVEIKTGQIRVIHRGNDWFNHFQFSPTDPTLLLFCHEGPWSMVDRIWLIRTDGSGLKRVHQRSIPGEIAGHEFWSPDGSSVWFDLQIPQGETFFLAGVNVRTGRQTRYRLERDQWSTHYNVSPDGRLFAGDGGPTNSVARAKDGKWIWLFAPQPGGTLRAERLCSLAGHDYQLEPNVHFTPDRKWVIFSGNMDGSAQVYAVEVAKVKAADSK